MIKIEKTEVFGWEAAIRGMRNPMNSWEKGDSEYAINMMNINDPIRACIGPNDHELMTKLSKAGSTHAKYRRMITVYCDIVAPLYWWSEYDTYKVGTVANSCSKMHKIAEKEFTLEDFSHEHLRVAATNHLKSTIDILNIERQGYIGEGISKESKGDKEYWYNMIQSLPSSYNQKRTVMLNYEVLAGIYRDRRTHKLDEWRDFCKWIESLPYSEIITLEEN